MVTPSEQEMVGILRALYGPDWFRQPKRTWEQIWKERRGELNHILGMRAGPKYQRGSVGITVVTFPKLGGTQPELSDIDNSFSTVAPAIARQSLWYNSDGSIQWDEVSGSGAFIVYAKLTTQTDDANDHTNEWWPDQPETNEGLNWDIRYTNLVVTPTVTAQHYFEDGAGADRIEDTWYLLDTVSNDGGDGTDNGAIGCNRTNGTSKNPNPGSGSINLDIEIRSTGSGSAVASQNVDLEVIGT
jgi:hypothetical protein